MSRRYLVALSGVPFAKTTRKEGKFETHTETTLLSSGLALLVCAVLIAYLSCTFFVAPSETAVVTRFGAPHREAGPGRRLRLPAPLETVTLVEVTRLREAEVSLPPRSPEEGQIEPRRTFVDWNVKSATDFLLNGANAEILIKEAFEKAAHRLSSSSEHLGPHERVLAAEAQALLDQQRLGIKLYRVTSR